MGRKAITIAFVALVVLAGCHGGGGGDSHPAPTLQNEDALKTDVNPGQNATVRAEIGDLNDLEDVELSYDIFNRTGAKVDEGTVPMSPTDDDDSIYTGDVPGYPAGFQVEYKVTANYDDGDSTSSSSSYTVSYIERIIGPEDDMLVPDSETEITVDLHTVEDVERVIVEYERDYEGLTDVNPPERIRKSPDNSSDTSFTFAIENSEAGNPENVSISYQVIVEYESGSTIPNTFTSDQREYRYRGGDAPVLIVPLTYQNNTTQPDFQNITERLDKMDAYFYEESDGQADFSYEVLEPSNGQYFTVDTLQGEFYNFSSGKYDKWELTEAGYDAVTDDPDYYEGFERNGRAVLYVHTNIDGTESRGMAFVHSSKAVVSWNDTYSTYAHELGHAVYKWEDYYGYEDKRGIIGPWGLMGSGTNNDRDATDGTYYSDSEPDYPAQIMGYHKWKQGWIDLRDINGSTLSENESVRQFVTYLKNDTNDESRLVRYELNETSIFQYYLFEAREPMNTQLPPHKIDHPYNRDPRGDGILMYGMKLEQYDKIYDEDYVTMIRSPDDNGRRQLITMEVDEYYDNDTILDPDAGIKVTAEDGGAGGNYVNVTRTNVTNVSGVNVFKQFECRELADNSTCDELQSGNSSGTTPITVRAQTTEGQVGLAPNGSFVNSVPGANQIAAGGVQKIFVPANTSARYVVESGEFNESAFNVTVYTQTVTRDENGERVASGLKGETVQSNESVEPELARLNVSDHEYDAGQLRTLASNETTVRVENNGIANLTDVTVSTDASWLSVNRTEFGTVTEASDAPLELTVEVAGGKPVGEYTANVTVRGNGTKTTQTQTIEVTVEVLPTVRWEANATGTTGTIAHENATTTTIVVRNDDSSNVPLRDLDSTVEGNVTRFDVTPPRFVETVEPGESVTLAATFEVPEDGIEEGHYEGTVQLAPLLEYQDYFEYPIDVPDDYVTPEPTESVTNVTVDAHGPSVDSTATFHPKKQVAMRKGSATERVTVDPIDDDHDVPAEGLTVSAEIPDGWTVQSGATSSGDGSLKVWIVEENGPGTPSGQSGERYKLSPENYDVTVTDGQVVLEISDLRNTSFGRYLTADELLEFEFKLDKQPKATEYEYSSKVTAYTRSPIDVYRLEHPTASIDVFDRYRGTPENEVGHGSERSRVAKRTVRADDGLGENATLTAPEYRTVTLDGERTHWLEFDLVGENRSKSVWIPLRESGNGTAIAGTPTDDGYVEVDAIFTWRVEGSTVGALHRGKHVEVTLPATANASGRDGVSMTVRNWSETDTDRAITFETADGVSVARANATGDGTAANVSIPVTVGGEVLDENRWLPNDEVSAVIRDEAEDDEDS